MPGELEAAEEFGADILRLCVEVGGVLTGEHGVGLEKKAFFGEMYGEADTKFMHRLRAAVDPKAVANRGKKLPSAEAPVLTSSGAHPLEQRGIVSRM